MYSTLNGVILFRVTNRGHQWADILSGQGAFHVGLAGGRYNYLHQPTVYASDYSRTPAIASQYVLFNDLRRPLQGQLVGVWDLTIEFLDCARHSVGPLSPSVDWQAPRFQVDPSASSNAHTPSPPGLLRRVGI